MTDCMIQDFVAFIEGSTPDAAGDSIVALQPSPCGVPRPIRLSDWVDEPEPPELVAGLLHRGCKMVVGGGSKSNKTWLLMDLSVSVANGSEFLGFPCTRGRVLFVNFELHPSFCRSRLKLVAEASGTSFADLHNFNVLNLRGYPMKLQELVSIIARGFPEGLDLIVFDPIYKLMAGACENSAGDVAAVLGEFDRLSRETGAAVVFAHHFTKSKQSASESFDRISGSGVFARDPDSLLTLTRAKRQSEGEAYEVSSTLRNHPPIDTFLARWEFPKMRLIDGPEPRDPLSSGEASQFSPERVLDVLREAGDGGLRSGEWQAACSERLIIGGSTFQRKRKELCDRGDAVLRGGRYYAAPPEPPARG